MKIPEIINKALLDTLLCAQDAALVDLCKLVRTVFCGANSTHRVTWLIIVINSDNSCL